MRITCRQPVMLLLGSLLLGGAVAEPIAEVNGHSLTREELAAALEQRYGYEIYLTLLLEKLILDRAEAAGLTPTEAEIEAELERFMVQHFAGSRERMTAWLARFARTEPQLRDEIRVQVAQFKLRAQAVALDTASLRAWFEENQANYRQPESVLFRQLLVAWEDLPGADRDTAIRHNRQLAAGVLARIRAGESFETVARQVSVDPSVERTGGLVGPTGVGMLRAVATDVAEALDRLEPGQVAAEPILRGDRFVLLQLIERRPELTGDFETLRRRVEIDYLSERMAPQEAFLSQLLQGARLTLRDPRYLGVEQEPRWTNRCGLALPGWLRDMR